MLKETILKNISEKIKTLHDDSVYGYIIYGKESFFVEYYSKKILDLFQSQFNSKLSGKLVILDGEEVSEEQATQLGQRSLFDEEPFYVLRNFEKKTKLLKGLMETLSSVRHTFLLVIKSTALTKELEQIAKKHKIRSLEIPEFLYQDYVLSVGYLAQKFQITIKAPEVSKFILSEFGGNLYKISNFFKTLSDNAMGKPVSISKEMIEKLTPHQSQHQIFDVFTQFKHLKAGASGGSYGKGPQSLQILTLNLLRQGEAPLGLLGIYAKHNRDHEPGKASLQQRLLEIDMRLKTSTFDESLLFSDYLENYTGKA